MFQSISFQWGYITGYIFYCFLGGGMIPKNVELSATFYKSKLMAQIKNKLLRKDKNCDFLPMNCNLGC